MTAWHTTIYNFDIALLRTKEQQYFYTAQGLLNIAIGVAQENYERLVQEGDVLSIPFDFLNGKTLKHKIEIKSVSSEIQLHAMITDENKNYSLTCLLTPQYDKKDKRYFVISNWHYTIA